MGKVEHPSIVTESVVAELQSSQSVFGYHGLCSLTLIPQKRDKRC